MRNIFLITLALLGSTLLSACHSAMNNSVNGSVIVQSKYKEIAARRTMTPIHRTAQQPYPSCHRHQGQLRGHCHR